MVGWRAGGGVVGRLTRSSAWLALAGTFREVWLAVSWVGTWRSVVWFHGCRKGQTGLKLDFDSHG